MTEHYDVIIVGTGAGGGTLAHTLAPSGKRLLLLERGDFLARELANWDPGPVFVEGRYISPDTWYDSDDRPFQPQSHYFVGGATKVYGAALYRQRPEDFGEIQHVDGVSPAWPVSYEEFEPWYTKAEWLYQVRGVHGDDPTEGGWSKQYPWPPVSHEPRVQKISDTLAAAGYHPFHAPTGILLDEANRREQAGQGVLPATGQFEHDLGRLLGPSSTCIRCATCDGYPCLVHAKADAEVIAVRPLLGRPNVTLLTGAEVVRVNTDASGRAVTEVVVRRDGEQEVFTGDVVAVCAGAANSAKILLASASDRHPAGLANGSGQVGRNYMYHDSKAVIALGKEPNPTVFQKTLGLNDFYFAGNDRQWPLGNIQMLGKSNAMAMKGEEPKLTLLAPRRSLDEVARHAVDFWLTTEDVPKPENRFTLDREGRLHLTYKPTNKQEAAGLYQELRKILNHIGMASHHVLDKNFYLSMDVPTAGIAHQAGTCRFGTDAATSVLDVNCKAHELDNLYVVDTSFYPSISAVNPALTAMANAIRVGEHLLGRMS
jgi:choline dehydrogenase-like flavoprotein